MVLWIPYLIALPWIINKAIGFNARMTSYRNVRFAFKGDYWQALGIFVLMPIAAGISFGLLVPAMSRMSTGDIARNLRYGTSEFRFEGSLGIFYKNLGATALFILIAGLISAMCGAVLGAITGWSGIIEKLEPRVAEMGNFNAVQMGAGFGAMLSIYVTFFLVFIFYRAGVRNILQSRDAGRRDHICLEPVS